MIHNYNEQLHIGVSIVLYAICLIIGELFNTVLKFFAAKGFQTLCSHAPFG